MNLIIITDNLRLRLGLQCENTVRRWSRIFGFRSLDLVGKGVKLLNDSQTCPQLCDRKLCAGGASQRYFRDTT